MGAEAEGDSSSGGHNPPDADDIIATILHEIHVIVIFRLIQYSRRDLKSVKTSNWNI